METGQIDPTRNEILGNRSATQKIIDDINRVLPIVSSKYLREKLLQEQAALQRRLDVYAQQLSFMEAGYIPLSEYEGAGTMLQESTECVPCPNPMPYLWYFMHPVRILLLSVLSFCVPFFAAIAFASLELWIPAILSGIATISVLAAFFAGGSYLTSKNDKAAQTARKAFGLNSRDPAMSFLRRDLSESVKEEIEKAKERGLSHFRALVPKRNGLSSIVVIIGAPSPYKDPWEEQLYIIATTPFDGQ